MGEREPKPLDEAALREAALRHLARYASTSANLVRVLDRRVARWVRAGGSESEAPGLRRAVRTVVARLVEAGVVDDAAFAAARKRRLLRAGKSGRAIGAHLASRGVSPALAAAESRTEEGQALAAAAIALRRRRMGPFATGVVGVEARRRALAMLARAGFAQAVAGRALGLGRDEAEALIRAFREGLG